VVVNGGEPETVTARWLVGCDGGHNIVREQAGIAFVGETREEVRMIVADAEVDGLDRDVWHARQRDEGLFSLCPLPGLGLSPGRSPPRTTRPLPSAASPRAALMSPS
jgi:2-polyprenyl-6-methoxyphenol hydroxylase-like FAD-dependent oxidoreductase